MLILKFMYKTTSINGHSKIVFKVWNTKTSSYFGSRRGYDWEWAEKERAKKWIKSEKLKKYEIHEVEYIFLAKDIKVV